MIIEEELENNLQHVLEFDGGFQFCHGITFVDLAATTQDRIQGCAFDIKGRFHRAPLGLEKHCYLLNIISFVSKVTKSIKVNSVS